MTLPYQAGDAAGTVGPLAEGGVERGHGGVVGEEQRGAPGLVVGDEVRPRPAERHDVARTDLLDPAHHGGVVAVPQHVELDGLGGRGEGADGVDPGRRIAAVERRHGEAHREVGQGPIRVDDGAAQRAPDPDERAGGLGDGEHRQGERLDLAGGVALTGEHRAGPLLGQFAGVRGAVRHRGSSRRGRASQERLP
nr:hypothetical protein [Dermacoccus nishinomiyaensis]